MKKILTLLALIFAYTTTTLAQDVIRVLAIGNSFSQDVVEQHLHELGRAEGKTIIVGNLYIGGCHLQKHLSNLKNEKNAYSYRKIDENGKKTSRPKTSIQYGLADEQWDYIMVQQVSGFGGIYASFQKVMPEYMQPSTMTGLSMAQKLSLNTLPKPFSWSLPISASILTLSSPFFLQ